MKILSALLFSVIAFSSCSNQPTSGSAGEVDSASNGVVTSDSTTGARIDSAGKPASSIIFDTAYGKGLLKQCSRPAPTAESFWIPTRAEIDQLEQKLSVIKTIGAVSFQPDSATTRDLSDFAIQYLGIQVSGKKLIYLNAFGARALPNLDLKKYPLETTPMIICDGGGGFWGAVYDPATGQFSQFESNGGFGGKGGKRGGK